MNTRGIQRTLLSNPYLFALLLLVIALAVNYAFQDNLFDSRVLNRNLRTFLPTLLLAVGQTVVIIGGGIDLSVGAMVSMSNAILVTLILPEATGGDIGLGILVAFAVTTAAGLFNGITVSLLRLQPIITTYATSFIFAGIALWVLPRPGGEIPRDMSSLYRNPIPLGGGEAPIEIPVAILVIALLLLLWWLFRGTRLSQFLYAMGDNPNAAYTVGVPVIRTRIMTYMIAGFFAACAGLVLTMLTGSGSPRIGDDLTLTSIVAVVLGGTRLRGGQGGIVGSILGVIILGVVRNIISFANVDSWAQTLVDALIIVIALAMPGLVNLISNTVREYRIRHGQIV